MVCQTCGAAVCSSSFGKNIAKQTNAKTIKDNYVYLVFVFLKKHQQRIQKKVNAVSVSRIGLSTRIRCRFPARKQGPTNRVRTVRTRFGGPCLWAGIQPHKRGRGSSVEHGWLLCVQQRLRMVQNIASKRWLSVGYSQGKLTASTSIMSSPKVVGVSHSRHNILTGNTHYQNVVIAQQRPTSYTSSMQCERSHVPELTNPQ
jgi:hypothetical protein